MDQEKIFNYQLTIQKLEEECQLYRNGTTGVELLELINEKDVEIKTLQSEVNNKNDIIQKLAKSSQDVLEKSQILQSEKVALTSERNILQEHVAQYEADLKLLTSNNETLTSSNKSLKDNLNEMSKELSERFDDISKLQTRCAKLVAEKGEKSRALDLEVQTNKKATAKLEESIKQLKKKLEINENALLIQQVNNEKLIKENKQLQDQYNEYQIMTQDKYEAINKQFTQLNSLYATTEVELKSTKSELKNSNKLVDELTLQKAELKHTLELISSNKDQQISELMQRVHQQEVTIHDFASRNPAPPTIPAMEQHTNAIHSVPLPNKMSESSNTVPAPKAKTKHSSSSNKVTSCNPTIRNSNTELDSELDKKIRRQEEYLKKRFLKDKTNSL